jgi:hypothetical protein
MNLNLLDPKLIALVAAVIVVIVVLAWLYVRKRRSTTQDCSSSELLRPAWPKGQATLSIPVHP